MENQLNIYMDESGKNKNKISLMGGISLPKDSYNNEDVQKLNKKLKSNTFKLHFTDYSPQKFDLYVDVFDAFLSIKDTIDINIMAYKRSNFKKHPLLASKINDMIYEKVPQRVIYGLLRKQSDLTPILANVYVEESTEYHQRNLDKKIKKQVNEHALYRFNNFKINTSKLIPKNTEIGVEFTDLVIGVVRFIMLNNSIMKDNGEISKTAKYKYELIYNLMPKLKILLSEVKLYELSQQDHLDEIPFKNYLKFFEAHMNTLIKKGYLQV